MRSNNSSKGIVPVFKSSPKRKGTKALLLGVICFCGIALWSTDAMNISWRALFDNNPVMLRAFAPSVVNNGTKFTVAVQAWDYCERLACGYDRSVSFSCTTDPSAILPASYKFQPSGVNQGFIEARDIPFGDQGMKDFEVTMNTPGIHYIKIEDSKGLVCLSNPILVVVQEPAFNIYWGDIHGHSLWCDGSGYISEMMDYARNIANLDIAAVTPHDHFVRPITGGMTWEPLWDEQKALVNNWNEPGQFATLVAYEYRGEYLDGDNGVGDMCLYSRTADIPFYPGFTPESTTPDGLFQKLATWEVSHGLSNSITCIPHHIAYGGFSGSMQYDWSYYNETYVRMVEIYSVHGNSEMPGGIDNPYPLASISSTYGNREFENVEINKTGYYARDALAMGFKVGFMASGDSHDGHLGHSLAHTDANHLLQQPISWKAFPHQFRAHHGYPLGLTAFMIPATSTLSRESAYDALWSRSVYATRNINRPILQFSIDSVTVGTNESVLIVPDAATPRNISLLIAAGGGAASNELEKVQIIKNNQVWQEFTPFNKTMNVTIQDTAPLAGMNYSGGETRDDGEYYITETADLPSNPLSMNTNGADVYYLRTFETEGDIAWIGPIWVST